MGLMKEALFETLHLNKFHYILKCIFISEERGWDLWHADLHDNVDI